MFFKIALIPYHLTYHIFKFFLEDKETHVFARNSYALNTLVPGKSDLDLTLFFDGKSSQKKISLFKNLSKIFFLVKEVNIYERENLALFIKIMNPFEKKRDPFLRDSFKKIREESTQEKMVFLLRMLKADLHHLKGQFFRQEKWRSYYMNIGVDLYHHPIEQFFVSFIRGTPFESSKLFLREFFSLDTRDLKKVDQFFYSLKADERKSFLLLYPFHWLVVSLRNHEYDKDKKIIERLKEEEKKLFYAQVRWEVFGIYSQYLSSVDKNLSTHIKNIIDLVSFFKDEDALEILDLGKKLIELINQRQ